MAAQTIGDLGRPESLVGRTPSGGTSYQVSSDDASVGGDYVNVAAPSKHNQDYSNPRSHVSLSVINTTNNSIVFLPNSSSTTTTTTTTTSATTAAAATSASSGTHAATAAPTPTMNNNTTSRASSSTTPAKLTKSSSNSSFSFARPSAGGASAMTATPTASHTHNNNNNNNHNNSRLYPLTRDDMKKSTQNSHVALTPRAVGSTAGGGGAGAGGGDASRGSYSGMSPAAAAHAAEAARPLEEILESVDTGPVGEVELTELRRLTASARRSEARKTLTLPTDVKKASVVLTQKVTKESNQFECRTSQETLYFQVLNSPPTPISLIIFMHGVDESLDTPGCAKLAEVWGARGHVVVGIELHRHGRSSSKHGKRATLPSAEVLISEVEELIMALRSSLLSQSVRLLPFALAGHSLGGALAIVLSYRFSKTLPERFLGCLLLAPAVDTLVDSSWTCCNCGCCCAPSYTHCCSLAHPVFACFASCFSKPCCGCCLPMDDPTTGNDGYHEEKERVAYRNSPYNTINRYQPASLHTLIEIMRMIQTPAHWPSTPSETPLPFFMLCGDKDTVVPPRSLLNFAKAQGMQRIAPSTKTEEVKGKTAVVLCLEKGNHQILGYRRKADGTDEIREEVLPLMAAWLESRITRPGSNSISRRASKEND